MGGLTGHSLVGLGLGHGDVGDGFREGHGGVVLCSFSDGVVRAGVDGVDLPGFTGGVALKDGAFGVVTIGIGILGVVWMNGGMFFSVVVLSKSENENKIC